MSEVNMQKAVNIVGGCGVTGVGTRPRGLTSCFAHADELGHRETSARQAIKNRIQHYSGRLKDAQAAVGGMTPHSNHEKKARAEIAKCKKKLSRLQKDLKQAT